MSPVVHLPLELIGENHTHSHSRPTCRCNPLSRRWHPRWRGQPHPWPAVRWHGRSRPSAQPARTAAMGDRRRHSVAAAGRRSSSVVRIRQANAVAAHPARRRHRARRGDLAGSRADVAISGAPMGDWPAGGVHPHRMAGPGKAHRTDLARADRRHLPWPVGPVVRPGQRHRHHRLLGGCGAHRRARRGRRRPRRRAIDRHRSDRCRGRNMSTAAGQRQIAWQRLSPRMLLVHPVHELLRELPWLIGAIVLGSTTGNQSWTVAVLAYTVVIGVTRWYTTSYRIDADPRSGQLQLRSGLLQRKVLSVPLNRIRSVQSDARLLHRLMGLAVVRVNTGQEAKGENGSGVFELNAVLSGEVPRLRAILLAGSAQHVDAPTAETSADGAVLARWPPSGVRDSPVWGSGPPFLA